jgi:CxxC motif-containing protein (DUF1111 family)
MSRENYNAANQIRESLRCAVARAPAENSATVGLGSAGDLGLIQEFSIPIWCPIAAILIFGTVTWLMLSTIRATSPEPALSQSTIHATSREQALSQSTIHDTSRERAPAAREPALSAQELAGKLSRAKSAQSVAAVGSEPRSNPIWDLYWRSLAHAGKVLFHHEWEVNDPLCPNGDGLGPVFNARSCIACHNQGGPGGSGSAEHNVTDFTLAAKAGSKSQQGVIHAEAISEEFRETLNRLDPSLPKVGVMGLSREKLLALVRTPRVNISQRNTPALFGAGLIDAIPDHVIIANEKIDNGRAPRLPDGRVGRFGWKGQTARLSDFVQAACANELGLSNPGHPQPQSLAEVAYQPRGEDLSQLQCDQLTAFVAALPQPVEKLPVAPRRREDAAAGKILFEKIGCVVCHLPNIGTVQGIYSDLLLHRMGQQLTGNNGGYGMQVPTTPSERPDEWRTPPLWGVASSAPYMHDGRAATLQAAIEMHGGQAEWSKLLYRDLSTEKKSQIVDFLNTLQAP